MADGTIFLVTSGFYYSDYHVEAAFSTREKAEVWLAEAERLNPSYYSNERRIEDYEFDPGLDQIQRKEANG